MFLGANVPPGVSLRCAQAERANLIVGGWMRGVPVILLTRYPLKGVDGHVSSL
jgi:hypothetical protein